MGITINPKWLEMVSGAIGETPDQVKFIVTTMITRGSKYPEIENHLRKLAAHNGKSLRFPTSILS